MLHIGCHLSISDGYLKAAERAVRIGANVFQYFSRNPQGYKAKRVDKADIKACDTYMDEHGLTTLTHAPYTLNLAAYDAGVRAKGASMFVEDLKTLDLFGGGNMVFHPGAHTVLQREIGLEYLYQNLNNVINDSSGAEMILLETMSGRGTELGNRFEDLRLIIDNIDRKELVGVCLDTCHVYAAGYDIVNNLDGVLEEFDKVIGLDKLCAIHLNDSAEAFNSKKDRHAKIGDGTIGRDALIRVINHDLLKELPFFLETPNDVDGYAAEIAFLKAHYNN